MSDKYELLRESLHELQREASARGGNNPRSQMILDLLADHEALQAECDRLNSYYKNGIDCFANPCEKHSGERTPPFSEFFERYGGRCLICVVDNNKTLQAECEKLRKHLQNLIDQTTPLVPEPGNPMWSRRIQLDEVMAERDQLRSECEKLRKDAERYQSLLEAVLREIPHREGRRGNAPGHGHSVPGVWDDDNGALAGKECAWCKVWNEALTAMHEGRKP